LRSGFAGRVPIRAAALFPACPAKEYPLKIAFILTLLLAMCSGCATSDQQKPPLDHGPRATSTPWLNQQIYGR
jgi:hypothetical protein